MKFSLEALGQVIQESRSELGLTQDELGRTAGYGAGAGVSISRIENGLTKPGRSRFEGIARTLGMTPEALEHLAEERTVWPIESPTSSSGNDASVKERVQRVQAEVERRTTLISKLVDEFNEAHDRARDGFFMRFVQIADAIEDAPQPDPRMIAEDDVEDASSEAAYRLRFTSFGVANVLAGGAGGAAAGAAIGGAAAYGTFMAAVSFGSASTGTAIAGLSGVAASNAALALLGGGTLAAGGAGIAGGTLFLTSIVATPAVLLAVGGLAWMIKRSREQQVELIKRLDEADAELAGTRRGFDSVVDVLPRATGTLNYISTHAGHQLERWVSALPADVDGREGWSPEQATEGTKPFLWGALDHSQRQRYNDFIEISASQLAVVSVNVQELMASRGEERERLIEIADEVLLQSQEVVEKLV